MRFTFGECRLDTASRDFSRLGKSVHLSPKAFDLFCILIQQRPRVVSKAELMQSLWPDTFVVEGNLPVLVAEIREAIGDRTTATAVVKTHHGIGYSFTAKVAESRSGSGVNARGTAAMLRIGERRVELGEGENEIGRDAACDVCIVDASVSRKHAVITITAVSATVADLGSKNGTRVNDTPVAAPTVLQSGDEILFGQVRAQFVTPFRDPASTLTL